MDFESIFREIREKLEGGADDASLKRIRATVDDPAFLTAWKDYLKQSNDFVERDQRRAELLEIMRLCGDGGTDRNNELTNVRYGIGIGGSMIASSIIGIGAGAVAAFFVIPIAAGAAVALVCIGATGRISKEERLYKDIEVRVGKIMDQSEAAND